MNVPFVDFHEQYHAVKDKIDAGLKKVFEDGSFILGPQEKAFEQDFARYCDAQYAVGVNSGTDALYLALQAIDIGPGDEVILPSFTFIATALCVSYTGARPVFVDIEDQTCNIDPARFQAAITQRTKAVIPVHIYGQPADMKEINAIAKKHDITVIEDACQAHGSTYNGKKAGSLGDIACFSFYATKNITSGEGGAVATNNEEYYNWLFKARLHGMSKNALDRYTKKYEHYDMEFLGYKCNMNNIQASLLINQLDRIEKFLAKKEKIAKIYDQRFILNPGLKIFTALPRTKHARYIYTILVDPKKRDDYLKDLQESGIGVAVNFRPIHLMRYYQDKYNYHGGEYPIAESIGSSTITIPLYPKLKQTEISFIVETVDRVTKS